VRVPLDYVGYYRMSVDYKIKSDYPKFFGWDDMTGALVFAH